MKYEDLWMLSNLKQFLEEVSSFGINEAKARCWPSQNFIKKLNIIQRGPNFLSRLKYVC